MEPHNRSITLTIPARINILGNPTDGLEGDYAVISAAVDLRAGARLNPSQDLVFEMLNSPPVEKNRLTEVNCRESYQHTDIPFPYNGRLDLVKGAINRLYAYSVEFREKFPQSGFHLAMWSEVPRQSGLGGSSLFILLTLAGMRSFYNLDPSVHNDYVLAELTQRVEAQELGITCGYVDRYVPLFGGLAYIDFRGKLNQAKLGEEPYATYEPLDRWVKDLPLLVITTGIQHNSGDVHGTLRPRYMQEWEAWDRKGGEPPRMVRLMAATWEAAWRGKAALLGNDFVTFGKLMNENHRLVNEMMKFCGYSDGAGWANNLMIATALENGALGAKLTGAGGGGSVYALVPPGKESQLRRAWEAAAQKNGLHQAAIYRPHISQQGILINAPATRQA